MWKQIWELREGLKETRDEIREINRKLDALVAVIQHLNTQIDHGRENARHEQEKLALRLDNALLRFERRLPPAAPSEEPGTE